MYRVGRTTGYGFEMSAEGFAQLRENGLTLVEHSLAQKVYHEPGTVAALAAQSGVKLWSCHLPFRPFTECDASSPDKEIRGKAYQRFLTEIKKGAAAGVDKFVLHPGTPFADESERPLRLRCAMEFVHDLAEDAHAEGAVIAVEDMPHCIGSSIAELEALLGTNDKLRICFDVNHLLQDSHSDFIRHFAGKIITVHFSDYDFIEEKHWFPTEGKIDWVKLIAELYGSGYSGPWIYECGLKEKPYSLFYDTAARILKEAGVPEL